MGREAFKSKVWSDCKILGRSLGCSKSWPTAGQLTGEASNGIRGKDLKFRLALWVGGANG